MRQTYQNLVANGVVDIPATRAALFETFSGHFFVNQREAIDVIFEFVRVNIEVPAAEQMGLREDETTILDTTSNFEELEDLQLWFAIEIFVNGSDYID